MPPVNKRPAPVSPDDFKARMPGEKDKGIDTLIDYINGVLDVHTKDMQILGYIDVLDSGNSPLWRAWSSNAIQKFREAGWNVAEDTTAASPICRFFMPQ